jgi:chorismate synthase
MNTFGTLFKISTFGESHGKAVGVLLDGCPAGLEIDIDFINSEMRRRRPGQSRITTPRKEKDQIEVLSGVFEGKTTGTPIALMVRNADAQSKDYSDIKDIYRPSHADFTYQQKYGMRDYRGGGRSSARETLARVAAGAIAKMYLKKMGIEIIAYVSQVGKIKLNKSYLELDFTQKENILRCPDEAVSKKMIACIEDCKQKGDTIGGVINCVIKNVPVGLGEPVFGKLHAQLGNAMLGINAVKGFEYGSGFDGVSMYGSEHNDTFYSDKNGKIRTKTNYSGGVQGGISNGEDIFFRTAFKPVATLMQDIETVDKGGEKVILKPKGRHDPCVLPRAVPIVEAMAALVIMDFYLLQNARKPK